MRLCWWKKERRLEGVLWRVGCGGEVLTGVCAVLVGEWVCWGESPSGISPWLELRTMRAA